MSVAYTNSEEDDYQSDTASFGISMDMFGTMTTVSLGYAHSWDTVENNNDPNFSKDIYRQNYRLGLSHVLTKDMIMELNYELVTDEGFLNNPYRSARYVDTSNFAYDHIMFAYDDFRDLRKTNAPVGKEQLYDFSADVAQIFVSI